jgi:hypothetical protein
MRQAASFLTAIFLIVSTSARAGSLLYDYSFSGYVSSSTIDTNLIKVSNSLVGQPFSAVFAIDPTDGIGTASLTTNLPFSFAAGSLSGLPIATADGLTFSGPATFLSSPNGFIYSASVGEIGGSFGFNIEAGNVLDVSNVIIVGYMRADNPGSLNLGLQANSVSFSTSVVPLPPALPMFASALLALGAVGFLARKRQKRESAVCLPLSP